MGFLENHWICGY